MPKDETRKSSRRVRLGLLVYLVLTFGLSWLPALLIPHAFGQRSGPVSTRLYASSLIYVALMGWQPLLAVWVVRRFIDPERDDGGRFSPSPYRVVFASIGSVLALVLSAMLVAHGLRALFLIDGPAPNTGPAPSQLDSAVILSFAAWTAALLIWAQTAVEELGWRGYFLVTLMRLLGPWPGLALHGVVWGLWYAPILLTASGSLAESALTSLGFVFTCCLLGVLLGWLRLASHSLGPPTTANALLTFIAGLPLLLQGDNPGLRGAAYGPAGWLPLAVGVLLLAGTRLRHSVRIPVHPSQAVHAALFRAVRERDDRSLH